MVGVPRLSAVGRESKERTTVPKMVKFHEKKMHETKTSQIASIDGEQTPPGSRAVIRMPRLSVVWKVRVPHLFRLSGYQGYLTHKKFRGTSLIRNTAVPRSQEMQGCLAHEKYRGTSLIRNTGVPRS